MYSHGLLVRRLLNEGTEGLSSVIFARLIRKDSKRLNRSEINIHYNFIYSLYSMSEQPAATVDFHIIQSQDFKTFYANGVFSSIAPSGLVNLNFYIDRLPLPDLMTYAIENNMLGPEKARSIRNGIVREVQQGALLDIQTVKNVISSLQALITAYEASTVRESANT